MRSCTRQYPLRIKTSISKTQKRHAHVKANNHLANVYQECIADCSLSSGSAHTVPLSLHSLPLLFSHLKARGLVKVRCTNALPYVVPRCSTRQVRQLLLLEDIQQLATNLSHLRKAERQESGRFCFLQDDLLLLTQPPSPRSKRPLTFCKLLPCRKLSRAQDPL